MTPNRLSLSAALLLVLLAVLGCDEGSATDAGPNAQPDAGLAGPPSNRARFTFDCDLNGVTGVLDMEVEAIAHL